MARSEYPLIDKARLERLGCFNSIIDSDSLFFINFMRLREARTQELTESYGKVVKLFDQVGILLKASTREGDRFYIEAFNLPRMAELEELCLGYSVKGTSGSGSGSKLKQKILHTGKETQEPISSSAFDGRLLLCSYSYQLIDKTR